MRFGVHVRPAAGQADIREVAALTEALGFESLFLPEHTHIPASVRSLYPDDPDWLEACKRMLDPFVALAAVAGVTTSLRLGAGVCLLPQHDPITLAKTVATLDVLSDGRVVLGVGAGWDEPEMRNHGVDPARRWGVLREHAEAMRAIWTNELAEYHGRHVDFDPIWQWPKPLQRPHPPIFVGGEGPRVLDRVIAFGDGWIPNEHPGVERRIDELRTLAASAGRNPLPVTVFAVPRDRQRIGELVAAGADRIVLNAATTTLDEARASLRGIAELVASFA